MSLIYPADDPNSATPMIHALIVGVGEYPYLIGGSKFRTEPAKYLMGLKQLTSPQVSAKRLANWLIRKLTTTHQPSRPLGTVELLLSPMAYTNAHGNATEVEDGTFDNIKKAFERWHTRCHRNADNIAVFYFCGHGIEWEKTYLLASDFGASKATPWENAIDFDITRMGFLGDCQARTVCCFVDACREVSVDQIQQLNVAARPLWDASTLPVGDRDALIFKAARSGEKAHGPANSESYFVGAIIRCLEQLGAHWQPADDTWKVNTNSLGLALRQLMRRTLIKDVGPGACDVGGYSNTPDPTELLQLPGVASAMAEITYDPDTALEYAELSCVPSGSGQPPQKRQPPKPEPWPLVLSAGSYDLAAHFSGSEYPSRTVSQQIILPPFTRCKL
jgi:hypothetical protein